MERELRARAQGRVALARRERERLEGLLGAAEARREGLRWRCEARRREVEAGQRRLADVRARELGAAAPSRKALQAQRELWQGLQVQLWRAQADLVKSLGAVLPPGISSEADAGACWGQLLLVGSVVAKVLGSPALHEAALTAGTHLPGFGCSRSRVWKLRSSWVASTHLPAAPARAPGEPPDPHELPLYPWAGGALAEEEEGQGIAAAHALGFKEARLLLARSLAAGEAALNQPRGGEGNRSLRALSRASAELVQLSQGLLAVDSGLDAAGDDGEDWEMVDACVTGPEVSRLSPEAPQQYPPPGPPVHSG